jgi:hypothetical protein
LSADEDSVVADADVWPPKGASPEMLHLVFRDSGGALTRRLMHVWWGGGGDTPVRRKVEGWLSWWVRTGLVERREFEDQWVLTEAGRAAFAQVALGARS